MASGTRAGVGALAIDMTKTYGTISGLVAQFNGNLYLTNVGNRPLLGLELPMAVSGGARQGRIRTWDVYVDGVKVDGLVPHIKGNKIELAPPFGALIFMR